MFITVTINDVVYQRMDLTLTQVDTGRLMPDQNILLLYCYSTPVQDDKTVNLLEDNSFANLYCYSLAHYMCCLYLIQMLSMF